MPHCAIDNWANFLANEKLSPDRVGDKLLSLIALAERMAEKYGQPYLNQHKDKLECRRKLVNCAMDLAFDLAGIKYRGKLAMGRGLLDAWNTEYAKRFGSTIGTAAALESKRRDIKTRLIKES